MAKKPFNPFAEFGEFIASHVDGSIFDVENPVKETAKDTENVGLGDERSNATEGKQRTGSTFTTAPTEKGKGKAVNRGNGGAGGNDGSGVSADKGDEPESEKDKPEPK